MPLFEAKGGRAVSERRPRTVKITIEADGQRSVIELYRASLWKDLWSGWRVRFNGKWFAHDGEKRSSFTTTWVAAQVRKKISKHS